MYVCVCLSVCPSVCLSVRLSVCMSVCLSVRLSVCMEQVDLHGTIFKIEFDIWEFSERTVEKIQVRWKLSQD